MYNRYDNDVHPRETVLDSLSSILDHNDSLQDHIKFLSSVSIVNFEFVMKCTVHYVSYKAAVNASIFLSDCFRSKGFHVVDGFLYSPDMFA